MTNLSFDGNSLEFHKNNMLRERNAKEQQKQVAQVVELVAAAVVVVVVVVAVAAVVVVAAIPTTNVANTVGIRIDFCLEA